MTTASTPLFRPLQLGPLSLPNRMVMAPMTRSRTSVDFHAKLTHHFH